MYCCVRGANFYVALYWAEELAAKDKAWEPLAKALKDNEEQIMKDLIECQVGSEAARSSHFGWSCHRDQSTVGHIIKPLCKRKINFPVN